MTSLSTPPAMLPLAKSVTEVVYNIDGANATFCLIYTVFADGARLSCWKPRARSQAYTTVSTERRSLFRRSTTHALRGGRL